MYSNTAALASSRVRNRTWWTRSFLRRGEEALHRRVVEAVAPPAHGLLDPVPLQHRAVGLARVLHPAVACGGSARGGGRRRWRAITRASTHSSARRWSAMLQPTISRVARSLIGGQVQPALAGRDVGDVGQPDGVGPLGDEVRGRAGSAPPAGRAGCRSSAAAGGARGGPRGPSRASAARPAGASGAGPPGAARRGPAASRRPAGGRRRCGRSGRAARPPPRPGRGRQGSRAARRRSRRRWRRRPGTASPRRGSPARRRRRRTSHAIPRAKKAAAFLRISTSSSSRFTSRLQPLRLRLLGLAGGQRLRRAGRQVLVAPPAQLAGAHAELGRDLAQPLAALQQPLDRLRLELGGEPPPVSPLRHPALLGCSGSLANPPLLRGRSNGLLTYVKLLLLQP